MPAVTMAGPIDRVAELMKHGNTHAIAQFFAASLDVSIMDNANVYSKQQAELVLDKFFKENKPQAVKIVHRVNSNSNYNYAVLTIVTDKGKYRIAFTLKGTGETMEMIELRIETEKPN